jgi:hypothetical protein
MLPFQLAYKRLKPFIFLFLFFIFSPPCVGAEVDPAIITELDDFVPVDAEDPYADESFMYFAKDFGLSLGTGAQIWTGAMAKTYKPTFPIADLRFFKFVDSRLVWQSGVAFSQFAGPYRANSSTTLRLMLISTELKYYFQSSYTSYLASTNKAAIVTPSPYFSAGLTYIDANFQFFNNGSTTNWRLTELNTPILGKIPMPVIPTVAVGMDIALQPRKSSLSLEARWIPIGSWAGEIDLLDEFFGEKRLGDLFSFAAQAVFVF